MFSAQELAIETIRQAGQRPPSEAQQRLGYLEELAKRVVDDYLTMETPSEALKQKLQEIQREINGLRDQVADEEEDRVADEQLAAGLGSLLCEPIKLFDALPADKQARIYQILFRGVRIDCRGRGTGRHGDSWNTLQRLAAGQ